MEGDDPGSKQFFTTPEMFLVCDERCEAYFNPGLCHTNLGV